MRSADSPLILFPPSEFILCNGLLCDMRSLGVASSRRSKRERRRKYRDSWVNGAMDNGSNCLLVQNVAGTERIGLSHSKVAWLMVQDILDNGSILFLFSTSKLYIFSH